MTASNPTKYSPPPGYMKIMVKQGIHVMVRTGMVFQRSASLNENEIEYVSLLFLLVQHFGLFWNRNVFFTRATGFAHRTWSTICNFHSRIRSFNSDFRLVRASCRDLCLRELASTCPRCISTTGNSNVSFVINFRHYVRWNEMKWNDCLWDLLLCYEDEFSQISFVNFMIA